MKVSIIVGFSACAAQSAYAESAQVPILMAASKEPKALKDINVLNKCPDLTLGSPSAACKSAPAAIVSNMQMEAPLLNNVADGLEQAADGKKLTTISSHVATISPDVLSREKECKAVADAYEKYAQRIADTSVPFRKLLCDPFHVAGHEEDFTTIIQDRDAAAQRTSTAFKAYGENIKKQTDTVKCLAESPRLEAAVTNIQATDGETARYMGLEVILLCEGL